MEIPGSKRGNGSGETRFSVQPARLPNLGPASGATEPTILPARWHLLRRPPIGPPGEDPDNAGITKSIVEAANLARQYHRPVFVFTNDGNIGHGALLRGRRELESGSALHLFESKRGLNLLINPQVSIPVFPLTF
jgi:hypothetical protein